MDKLELKYLAPYLPYELRLTACSQPMNGRMCELLAKHTYSTIKPILRPLSDLSKEIDLKHHDSQIIPIDYISTSIKDAQSIMRRVANNQSLDSLEYWKIERLLELHFDVFGLIPAGLAISYKEAGL